MPRHELPPPAGFPAGSLVWVGRCRLNPS
jgi:hypothetical protein